ncbi:host cell division inhibitor Icd-like protein [Salmonella enterica]|nr:host cell division inhibitor Icd-like protein [Salmonella enterica]EHR1668030.1 host cell division inhibitor Icd-like protein [Salmonella enterica]EHR8095420.1 host cell division inhibitor Icd-like protein [Salmonella enterica]EIE9497137.1 host cell division inhibitor Icd-like protein [Salmonella enterica]EIQ5374182.1 host cell division inhibitor Icd-like protein [Salmonella enterica]
MKNHTTQQREQKNRLPVCVAGLYIPVAGVNPPAGFSSLNIQAGSRYFSVKRYFYARKTTCTRLMAGRNGGALALAGFLDASLLTPLRLATPFSSALARFEKPIQEAVTMVNANPCPYPLFIWRFFSGQNSAFLTTTAASEHEASLQLPAVHLVFVARIRLEGSYHA